MTFLAGQRQFCLALSILIINTFVSSYHFVQTLPERGVGSTEARRKHDWRWKSTFYTMTPWLQPTTLTRHRSLRLTTSIPSLSKHSSF